MPEETIADLKEAFRADVGTVPPDAPISRVVELLLAHPESRAVHVVGTDGKLLGTVSWRSVLKATGARVGAREPGLFSLVRLLRDLAPETAGDLMRTPTPVHPATPVRDAILLMAQTQQNDLPVVDEGGRFLGEVNGRDVMTLALRVFRQTEADLEASRQALERQRG